MRQVSKKHNSLSFLTILVSIVSCAEPNRAPNLQIPIMETTGKFKKEIPTYEGSENMRDIKQVISNLALDSIDGGFNKLQIRVWLGHSLAKNRDLVIIKQKDLGWYADIYEFTLDYNGESEQSSKFKAVSVRNDVYPKSGWEVFLTHLNTLKVFESLQQADVQIHRGCGGADGMGYYFELASPTVYRFQYHCDLEENLQSFVTYLEDEFAFEFVK